MKLRLARRAFLLIVQKAHPVELAFLTTMRKADPAEQTFLLTVQQARSALFILSPKSIYFP